MKRQSHNTKRGKLQSALDGKVGRLQQQAAALFAARAAAHHYIRILLLAGEPGGLAIVPARGRVRIAFRIYRAGKLPEPVRRSRLLQIDAGDSDLLLAGRRSV